MEACEQAVALAPDDGRLHSRRGIARAMTGDYKDAIEDFEDHIAWLEENHPDEKEVVAQRNKCILILRDNRNPFDNTDFLDFERNLMGLPPQSEQPE